MTEHAPHPLEELARRVEEGAQPDRELDAIAWCCVEHPQQKPQRNFFYANRDEWGFFTTNQPQPGMTFHDAPALTSSLDAVRALLERVLPGWKWSVGHFGAQCRGNVWFDPDQIEFASFADEPARALLAAVLRAVEGARR